MGTASKCYAYRAKYAEKHDNNLRTEDTSKCNYAEQTCTKMLYSNIIPSQKKSLMSQPKFETTQH